jgi:hypothetical protein
MCSDDFGTVISWKLSEAEAPHTERTRIGAAAGTAGNYTREGRLSRLALFYAAGEAAPLGTRQETSRRYRRIALALWSTLVCCVLSAIP